MIRFIHTEMMRLIIFFFLVSGLTACGGGGTADTFSHDTSAVNYTGIGYPANITLDNISKFVSPIFSLQKTEIAARNSQIQQATPPVQQVSTPKLSRLTSFIKRIITQTRQYPQNSKKSKAGKQTENGFCEISGTYQVDVYSDTEIKIHFFDCIENDYTETNGTINISFLVEIYSDGYVEVIGAKVSFTSYLVTFIQQSYSVVGIIDATFNGINCNDRYTHNLMFERIGTKEQTRFANFVYEEFCQNNGDVHAYNGRIYNSSYGYIDIETTDKLVDSEESGIPFPDRAGRLVFKGLNSSAEMKISSLYSLRDEAIEYFSVDQQNTYLLVPTIYFLFDFDGDSIHDTEFKWKASATTAFATDGSFSDSDGDDMPDIWEEYYRLDKFDPGDGDIDTDGDGYSNADEYRYFGDPGNLAVTPFLSGSFTTQLVSTNSDVVRKGQNIQVEFATELTGNQVPSSFDVMLKLSANAELVGSLSNLCILQASDNTKLCKFTFSSYSNTPGVYYSNQSFEIASTDEQTVAYSIEFDTGALNNTSKVDLSIAESVEFLERQSDIGIRDSNFSSYILDHLQVGTSQHKELEIYNLGPDLAKNSNLVITFPPEIRPDNAYISFEYPPYADCQINENTVSCALGDITNKGRYKFAEINLNLTALSAGRANVTANITSDSNEQDYSNNTYNQEVFLGSSFSQLQTQIDVANPGDEIVIPAGNYVASSWLRTNGKPIHLRAESSNDPVIFWITSGRVYINDPDSGSSITGVTFLGGGSSLFVSGTVSVTENKFYSVRSKLFEQGVCEKNSLSIGSTIATTIERNYFDCTYIESYLPGATQGNSDLTIRNNIFTNGSGDTYQKHITSYLYLRGVGMYNTTYNGIFSVYNNTFMDSDGTAIYVVTDTNNNNVNPIKNNIFLNISRPFEHSLSFQDPFHVEDFEIENNIFSGYTDIVSGIGETNLFIDPQIDSTSFTPLAGSPAIDAGTSAFNITIDYYGNPRPLDGGSNSTSEIDIGAVEYQ